MSFLCSAYSHFVSLLAGIVLKGLIFQLLSVLSIACLHSQLMVLAVPVKDSVFFFLLFGLMV
jgi:hypothetical protein